MTPSTTHLVVIPSYNSGPTLLETVRSAHTAWAPVWVVVDGSSDGTETLMPAVASRDAALHVLVLAENRGKGGAVEHALRAAAAAGFTHALVFDADGQHSASHIPGFMAASAAEPRAMVLGVPEFDATAPPIRVKGRRISNWWARLETGGLIGDSLFGFRVYPIAPLLAVMRSARGMRRYDFDPEAAVRLCWRGVPVINLPAPVTYPAAAAGGVSHFRYGRDNLLLTAMHVRLVLAWLGRGLTRRLRRRQRFGEAHAAEAACGQTLQEARQHGKDDGLSVGATGGAPVMQEEQIALSQAAPQPGVGGRGITEEPIARAPRPGDQTEMLARQNRL
ncbi:MAG: glycosyltransferase family 2 protein [Acetobacteraceae bacterium]